MTELYRYLIVCPLVFLAGFVDAVAGGGGLISLPAYLIAGIPVHYAIGTNKLSSSIGTTVTIYRLTKGKYIPWKLALICAAFGLAGAGAGARLALMVNERVFQIILLIALPLTGAYITFGKPFQGEQKPLSEGKTLLISVLISLLIGVYDGFYGPGTGTFLLLCLTELAHLKLASANGVAKLVNITTNLTALAVYLLNGRVMILLGLVAAAFSIGGNYIGTRYFERNGANIVKPVMATVLCVFFIKLLIELI